MIIDYLYSKILKKLRGKAILRSRIHPTSVVYSGSAIIDSSLDRYSYCGYDCQIVSTVIGAFCSISDHVYVGGAEHPLYWVSTSPVFQNVHHSGSRKRFSRFDLPPVKKTVIGSDVWIGHAVTIKQGVTIGHGAVIGSNALVTKDVPPYAIVGGIPARIIDYRFDEDTINALLNSKWWELSDDVLQECAFMIREPKAFIQRLTGYQKRREE